MKFKNIRKVFIRDWKNIAHNPFAMIIVFGICLIPSLYAWVNIQACWDVYENTGNIPVAVVNNDKPALLNDTEINIGESVIEQLEENDKIDWKFVNERQAELGIADGTYFAAIELPEDFSENFATIFSDNPVKPHIIYKVDTKVNPVAEKITETAKNTLVQEIESNFIATVNETVFAILNPVGSSADENLRDVIKMKDAIVKLSKNMNVITKSMDGLHDNADNLNQFLTSMNAAWPMMQNSLNTVTKNAQTQQELSRATHQRLNDSLTYTDTNLHTVQNSSQRIHVLLEELNNTASEGNVAKMNNTFSKLDTTLSSMDRSIGATITYLQQYKKIDWSDDADNASDRLSSLQTSLTNLRSQLEDLQKNLKKFSSSTDGLSEYLGKTQQQLQKQIEEMDALIGSTISSLETINKILKSPEISAVIQELKALRESGIGDAVLEPLKNLQNSAENITASIQTVSGAVGSAIRTIDHAMPKIKNAISFLDSVQKHDKTKKQEVGNLITSLDTIQSEVEGMQAQLTAIQQEANPAAALSKEKRDTINKDLYEMQTQLNTVLTSYNQSIRGDLDTIGSRLVVSSDTAAAVAQSAEDLGVEIGAMLKTAQEGADLTTDFTGRLNNKLNEFSDVIESLGSKLELVNNNDIAQMISILQNNPEFMGDFIAMPFEQRTETINDIPNYGSSMAPIYTTLALWVGCLILNSILRSRPVTCAEMDELTLREKHFGKMLTFCSFAIIQGLIVALGNIFLVKIYTVHAFLFVCVAVYSSIVFCIITYTLYSTLGNSGKAIAIIYMIFQLAGSGGTYPIQVDPQIFRVLQPLFPFAYTVSGFREAIAGPLITTVLLDFVVLSLFAFVFLICGYFLVVRLNEPVHRFEEEFESSGLGE
ncbi:YhgE/Pip domain-containing protein [Clostridium minihomine]|uniref:YhgE/Pip domain-containing protein n=1 Tax=Clostridium minihomine TaxID=2045012 RepID=UPI000C770D2E|nr:YhgE/Pip domain-containing protein [Clostridium minihomine]